MPSGELRKVLLTHSDEFLTTVERLRWDSADRGSAPSSIATGEAWTLRNAKELAPQLP